MLYSMKLSSDLIQQNEEGWSKTSVLIRLHLYLKQVIKHIIDSYQHHSQNIPTYNYLFHLKSC